ncbi:Netrin receptor UNC5 [Aphelenchoides besseyi]|nr:Netrin receptor UNC5 [Aphelenchoides besseyi]KAI6224633.1 Netrin receptor UNC5 [Aphelenchoides besseyi]
MNEISIVDHPRSSYIVRSRPAILSCRALNANRVRFKCNSRWLNDDRHEIRTGVDEPTGRPFHMATVEINRQDVEADLTDVGEFTCQCFASTNPEDEGVRSEEANVRLAYIRKHFYQTPISDRVAEGRTVQLPCVPPDGDPKVEVYWLRNGKEISSNLDSNLILANDGSLILSASRLSDSANYTCEARNLANRRLTEPAELIVYVDGAWSPWGQWHGDCAVDCNQLDGQLQMNAGDELAISRVLPQQRRTRACNNPPPLNGGAQCTGTEDEYRPCPHDCHIDGVWSQWSTFSECNTACQRLRTRHCAAPAPANGGRFCQGRDTDSANCSTATDGKFTAVPAHCLPEALRPTPLPALVNQQNKIGGSNDLLHGGQTYVLASFFCFAFLLVIITLLIAALFCRRRRKSNKHDRLYYGGAQLNANGDVRTVLLQQQKAALMAGSHDVGMLGAPPVPPPVVAPYVSLPNGVNHMHALFANSYTLKSTKSYASNYSNRHRTTTSGSRAALIGNSADHYSSSGTSSNGGSGSGLTPIKRPNGFCTPYEDYATLYECIPEPHYTSANFFTEDENTRSPSETHDQSATIVAAQVDEECSRIELRRCGAAVSLSAKTFERSTMVFLAVSDDLQDRPKLHPDETWLSSAVEFGKCESEGADCALRRPVAITIEHFASTFPKENWQFVLYADYGAGWTAAVQLGEETINVPAFVQVERTRFHILTDQFGRFLLAGRRKGKTDNFKRVQLRAYASLPIAANSSLLNVRVYVVPDTTMAIENVRKQEEDEELGGQLISDSKEFLMNRNGTLCLSLEEDDGIQSTDDGYMSPCTGTRYVEIPEPRHLWVSQNGLHCNLSLGIRGPRDSLVNARLNVYQKGSSVERQTLLLSCNPNRQNSLEKCLSDAGSDRLVSLDFHLSPEVKNHLSILLDRPTDSQNDWRGLARKLGFDRYLQYFGLRPGCSPSSLIFDLWESTTIGSERAILDLLQTLRIMGRHDAVAVVEQFVAQSNDFIH